jgi:polygalacturonase
MCFKGAGGREMENVLVENCTAYSGCNALKFGTNSEAGFRNVLIRNVRLGGVPVDLPAFHRRNAISGISWESVDGGTIEDVVVSGARIDRADSPIFVRLGNRSGIGAIDHLVFEQISGSDNGSRGSIIAGIPGARVKNVVVRDMNISIAGGGKVKGGAIPEAIGDYPESSMFGENSPAYGFWLRHAEGISFENVKIRPTKPDGRPGFLAGDDTLEISGEDQK